MGDDPHGTSTPELRDHLTALIALILEEKLQLHSTHHIDLVSSLQEADSLRSTRFISLNYDIIIDNALEYVAHGIPDYGVRFTPTPTPHRGLRAALLKLHGSLNWLYCPACNALSLFSHHKVGAELPGAPLQFRCPDCHELRVSTIIPPTFFKVLSNFHLQQVWKRAEEEFKKCRRIIFCGYSFPDADIHFKYLLKRAEVNRPGEFAQGPEVFIVNEHPGKNEREREMERDRYMRFFRDKGRVHWTALSFQEFAANPARIEDESRWTR
jgi:hypothetical protein